MSFGRSRSNFFVNLSDHNTYTHQENLLIRQKKDFKFTATIESISLKEPVVSQKKRNVAKVLIRILGPQLDYFKSSQAWQRTDIVGQFVILTALDLWA